MQDANAPEETCAEISEELSGEKLAQESEGTAEESEFLPYTAGDLPEDVQNVLEEAASSGVMPDDKPAANSEVVPDIGSVDDGGCTSDEPADELEEIRSIFRGRAATDQPDFAQVAAGMERELESNRREIAGEMAAVERRLRDEIKGSLAELRSEVEDRATTRSVEDLLNLVSLIHRDLGADLDKHDQETKSTLNDLFALMRELARTIAIWVGGVADDSRDLQETIVPEETTGHVLRVEETQEST